MKKRVGILTFHRSDSYGASLQAYATIKAVEQLGYDAELIDYTNSYEQQKHKSRGQGIKRVLKDAKWQIASRLFRNSQWLNRAFGNKEVFYEGCISKEKYHNHDELSKAHYDILLAGSDQIWNPDITDQIDTAYLLEYGKAEKRVSYASSMGSRALFEKEKEVFRELLSKFDAIGVREEFAKKELSELTDVPISVVCDPTILVDEAIWNRMADQVDVRRIIDKPKYAIAFFVGGYTKEIMELVQQAKRNVNDPIYNIQKNKRYRFGFDKCLAGITVPEFVALLKNAEYVITDSFHGVVLSMLLKKNVVPLINRKNPVRVEELLQAVGLKERLNNPDLVNKTIDYEYVDEKLNQMKKYGLSWLNNAMT